MQEPKELIKYFNDQLTENEIQEEQILLAHDLDLAGQEFKGASQLITSAVLRLEAIRASGRFRFGYISWNECLNSFIEERGIGSSSMKKWLKIVRIWKFMGREPEKLLGYAGGIQTIEPIMEGRYRLLNEYNQVTGEPVSLTKAWDEKLDGETAVAKLNDFIDQITPEMTRKMMTHSIKQEAPSSDKIDFDLVYENDTPVKMKWSIEEVGGAYSFGELPVKDVKKMHPKVFSSFCRRLGL